MTLDLSTAALDAWKRKLPADVRACLETDEVSAEGSTMLMEALASATPGALPDLLRSHYEDVQAFGRTRRVRVLCFLAANGEMAELTRTDDEDGGSDVGALFFEDVRAVVQAIGPRLASSLVSMPVIDALAASSRGIEHDFAAQRGMFS